MLGSMWVGGLMVFFVCIMVIGVIDIIDVVCLCIVVDEIVDVYFDVEIVFDLIVVILFGVFGYEIELIDYFFEGYVVWCEVGLCIL